MQVCPRAMVPVWLSPSSCFQTNPDGSLQGHLQEERGAAALRVEELDRASQNPDLEMHSLFCLEINIK